MTTALSYARWTSRPWTLPYSQVQTEVWNSGLLVQHHALPVSTAAGVCRHCAQDARHDGAESHCETKRALLCFRSGVPIALSRVRCLDDMVLWGFCKSSIHIQDFYRKLLEWCDCVDMIRPAPPTEAVPYPERADDVSDAPLHAEEDKPNAGNAASQSTAKSKGQQPVAQKARRAKQPQRSGNRTSSRKCTPTTKANTSKKPKLDGPMHTLANLPSCPGVRLLQQATTAALGGLTPTRLLNQLKLRPLADIVSSVTQHGSTLDTLVTILNALPTQFAQSHHNLRLDPQAAQQCHHLLLQTFKPVVTTGDGNCAFNALSLTLTGSQLLSGLVRLLCLHSLIKHSSMLTNIVADAYPLQSSEQHDRTYREAIRVAVTPNAGWGTDLHLFAVCLLLQRPIFQYNTFYTTIPDSTLEVETLGNTRDVHHLAERFLNREDGMRTHLLYCNNVDAVHLSASDLTQLTHTPLALCHIGKYHWVAMLPISQSALAHLPIPTTRLFSQ